MVWAISQHRVTLSSEDQSELYGIIDTIFSGRDRVYLIDAFDTLVLASSSLPMKVREAFHYFKLHQRWDIVCVETKLIQESQLPETPRHHQEPANREQIGKYDAIHLMFAACLGDAFAWRSIQSGFVFNDIIPVPEHRALAASSGFDNEFGFHTEDAFHPLAGDYLGLVCLRNPDGVATTLTGLDPTVLSAQTVDVLFESRFVIGANIAQEVSKVIAPSPILFGHKDSPYFRINMNNTRAMNGDREAEHALTELTEVLLRDRTQVVFRQGEYWYIDNLRIAHGREAYTPRFDGRDRWLRRLYISSAYRYSRGLREQTAGRVLEPKTDSWPIRL